MKTNTGLSRLDRTVGEWIVTGSHPYMAGRTLRGRVMFERIEGGAIFGTDSDDGSCTMLYFDERNVESRTLVKFGDRARTRYRFR
jgi:hypothetical protein